MTTIGAVARRSWRSGRAALAPALFATMIATGGCAPGETGGEVADESNLEAATSVTTTTGPVRGDRSGRVAVFKGIPFAAPPVGALRWRAPEPAAPWTSVRAATEFGSKCTQTADNGDAEGSEDCLTLNVWRPIAVAGAALPVVVFFHGGFNAAGSTGDKVGFARIYDGKNLAEDGGVVVVTANYRVGAMGFLAHPSLAPSADVGPGNYGLLDQIAALEWVQKNAAAFGGDPTRVTVSGQSAGAFNTCALVASPRAKGLFTRAAMHSGGCRALTRETATRSSTAVAERVGCAEADAAACLRGKPASLLTTAATPAETTGGSFFWPVIDGAVLPKAPLDLIRAGEHNHVPILLGSTTNEATVIVKRFDPDKVTTAETLAAAIKTTFPGPIGDEVVRAYPVTGGEKPADTFTAALGDGAFICPTRRAARAFAGAQTEPVRRFEFSHVTDDLLLRSLGASHGFDLFFLFQNYLHLLPTPRERRLGETMASYWGRFAATGDPNGGDAIAWPVYEPEQDVSFVLDTEIKVAPSTRLKACDFWDKVQPSAD